MLTMLKKRKRKEKGQSALEYTILIIVVLGALLSIQVYIKRGLQGGLFERANQLGKQYSPGNTNVVIITITNSKTSDTFINGTTSSTILERPETTTTDAQINILNIEQEFWGKSP